MPFVVWRFDKEDHRCCHCFLLIEDIPHIKIEMVGRLHVECAAEISRKLEKCFKEIEERCLI